VFRNNYQPLKLPSSYLLGYSQR